MSGPPGGLLQILRPPAKLGDGRPVSIFENGGDGLVDAYTAGRSCYEARAFDEAADHYHNVLDFLVRMACTLDASQEAISPILVQVMPDAKVAAVFHTLGTIRFSQGLLTLARPYYEMALNIRRAVNAAANSPGGGGRGNNGGDGAGRRRMSIQARRSSIAGAGGDSSSVTDADVASSLHRLGLIDYRQGRMTDARFELESAVEMNEALHGDRPDADMASCMHHLALVYYKGGDAVSARELFEKTLAMERELHSGGHRSGWDAMDPTMWRSTARLSSMEAPLLHHLGKIYEEDGDLKGAQSHYEEALAALLGVVGDRVVQPENMDMGAVAALKAALGRVVEGQGDIDGALAARKAAFVIRAQICGADPEVDEDPLEVTDDFVASLHQLGRVALVAGDYGQARQCYQKLLSPDDFLRPRGVPPSRLESSTTKAHYGFGSVCLGEGAYAEACEHFTKAATELRRRYPETAAVERAEPCVLANAAAAGVPGKTSGAMLEYTSWSDIVGVLNACGDALLKHGDLPQARSVYEDELATIERLHWARESDLGEEERGDWLAKVAHATCQVGTTFFLEEQYVEAERYYHKALCAEREIHGGGNAVHADIAGSLCLLGNACFHRHGCCPEALDHYQNSLRMRKILFGGKDGKDAHADIAHTMHQLGLLLIARAKKVSGRERLAHAAWVEAKCYLEGALAMTRKLNGVQANKPAAFANASTDRESHLAGLLRELGHVYVQLGMHAEAKVQLEASMSLSANLGGDSVPAKTSQDHAVALHDLGDACYHEGDLPTALEHYNAALAVLRAMHDGGHGEGGVPHPDVATSLEQIGDVLGEQGAISECLRHYEESLAIRRELHKEAPHASTATLLLQLGVLHNGAGRHGDARDCLEEGLDQMQAVQQAVKEGGDSAPASATFDASLQVARASHMLGSLYFREDQFQAARERFETSVALKRQLREQAGLAAQTEGNDSAGGREILSEIAATLHQLGNACQKLQDRGATRAFFAEALAVKRELYASGGLRSASVAATLYCMGNAVVEQCEATGDVSGLQEAANMFQEAYDIQSAATNVVNPSARLMLTALRQLRPAGTEGGAQADVRWEYKPKDDANV